MHHPKLNTVKPSREFLSVGGSKVLFTQVYNDYYTQLYFLTKKMVQDAAPDILADVFTELWVQEKEFESERHLFFYLRAMVSNACFDFLKKKNRDSKQIDLLTLQTDQQYTDIYFRDIVEGHLFTQIKEEIDKLPPHLREVFTLSYIKGLKNNEIASLLQIKDNAVRVRKAEALKKIRTAFHGTEPQFLCMLLLIKNIF